MIFISYIFTVMNLTCATTNSVTQLPQVTGNTLIFEGPNWKHIDNAFFSNYSECDTVIIRNTKITNFPTGLAKLKNIHTVECINNSELSCWNNLFLNLYETRKKIKKIVMDGNKHQYLSNSLNQFIKLEELTISNSPQKNTQRINLLSECTNLTFLNLSNSLLEKLPNEIHKLKKLKHLDLSGNCIEALPVNFYDLKRLEYLDLSGNRLREVNPEITLLSNLKSLNLSNNYLSDLPSSFYSLSNLITLNLSKNSFLNLSPDIYKLSNLQSLNLEKNKLDTLPTEFCNLQKLEVLMLNQNTFHTIPAVVFLLTNLKELYVNNNKISNILIDNGIFNIFKQKASMFTLNNTEHSVDLMQALNIDMSSVFNKLSILDISYNHLTEINDELSNLKNLEIFDASNNNISIFAAKLSDWPLLLHLNLRKNKLALAPYFENNYDVSNIELDVSENFIVNDSLNKYGYGINQIYNFKFKKFSFYPQYKNKQSFEDLVQQENTNKIHWKLKRLNSLKANNIEVYKASSIISDMFLMKIWHLIIKWFVYDSKTNKNSEYNDVSNEYKPMTILFNKIINSGIIEQLEQTLNESNNFLLTEKFTELLKNAIVAKGEKSNDLAAYILLSYLKLEFKQILEKIDKAGNDLEKIKDLRNKITSFCNILTNNTNLQPVEILIHRYSLNYKFKFENSDDKFQSFIYSRINFYRELAFDETYKSGYNGDMKYYGIVRRIFCDKIGVYDDIYIIRERYIMEKIDRVMFMKEFFDNFSVTDIQNKILSDINNTMPKEAFDFLEKCEKDNLTDTAHSSSNNPAHFLTQQTDKTIGNEVIRKYYTTIQSENDSVSFELNLAGMIKILNSLGFIFYNNAMETDN